MKRVLIAYDGSDYSRAAIKDLKQAGLGDRVEAVCVSVADVFMPPKKSGKNPTANRAQEAALKKAAALSKEAGKILADLFPRWKVKSDSFADSPAWGIIKKAREWKADLIVMGAHGLSSTGRLILGSIAQMVATQAPCSVRVVREKRNDTDTPPRIVIGNDQSQGSEKTISEVASRNWPKGTAVHLITAVESRLTSLLSLEMELRRSEQSKAEFEVLEKLVEKKAETLRARKLIVSTFIEEGDPKKILLEEAEKWGADEIFVGARGISGIKHVLIGSVSSSLAARAHCTVEIVRSEN